MAKWIRVDDAVYHSLEDLKFIERKRSFNALFKQILDAIAPEEEDNGTQQTDFADYDDMEDEE